MDARFTATRVSVDDMGDYLLVGFADESADDYLMLQRSYQDDDQDRSLGLDTYYVERADQRTACYGGIRSVTLHGDRIAVDFDPRGQAAMGGLVGVTIMFEVDAERFTKLASGLQRIFTRTDCLRLGL